MITVITPTYNRESTLARAIDSVLAQDYQEWELVVVDDGSTDGTAALLDRYADPRIRVVRHERNVGATAAFNTGFDNIRGDWFTLLGSDDEMMPDALSTLASAAERTGATAVTCTAIDSVTGEPTGTGAQEDGWLDLAATARLRGDHWGITRTDLLGTMRFDERHRFLNTVWFKIGLEARRYYIRRGLLLVHTEGADRLTVRRWGFGTNIREYRALADDREFLAILREVDPKTYRRHRNRILVSKLLFWAVKPARDQTSGRRGLPRA